MNKIPCIRGLTQFKKGCPQRKWNGEDGCPAWVDIDMDTKGGQEKIEIRECLDLYTMRLQYYNNMLLEGNQQAIESLRNGMLIKDDGGNIVPKPSNADMILLNILANMNSNNNDVKVEYIEGDVENA